MEVYIETIIIDNFIIDYIILQVCAFKRRKKLAAWRGMLAGIIGVLVAIVATFDWGNFASFAAKIFGSFSMVLIAFGRKDFFRSLLDFYFFTFAIGGCALGFLYLKEDVADGVFKSVSNLPTGVIFGAVFFGYILIKRVIYIFSGEGVENEYSFAVEIENADMSRLIFGFLDTGNLLVFSGDLRGVCVCECVKFASFFAGQKPRGQVIIHTASGEDFLSVYNIERIKVYKFSGGMLEKASLKELIIEASDVAVALSKHAIGDCDMLLSPRLFY